MRAAACALLLLAAAAPAQDVLVIAPEELARALPLWRRHREAQGHEIAVRPPRGDLPALVKQVHAQSGGRLKWVLLLGDVNKVPCAYVPAVAIREYEREKQIATDFPLADLDGDDLPDLAVGRLPADTPAEAKLLLGRVVAYEDSGDFSPWRRRVNFIAGVAGFGKVQDAILEQVTMTFLRTNIPAAFDLHVTYANPASPFCPPPARVGDAVIDRFNEGALFVAYAGHGSRLRLDRLRYGDQSWSIFDEDAAARLKAEHGAPVAFFCACSTGFMDGAPDCLAETVLREPGGPVAVIASSRVSMPYANGVFSKELMDALFKLEAPTVGEAVQLAKRRMMVPEKGDTQRQSIDMTARLAWKPRDEDLAAERREHLFLYNLFGDPSLRLPRFAKVSLACAEEARVGGRLKVEGKCPVEGKVLVELVSDRTPNVPPRAGDSEQAFAEAYARSNAWVKARCEVEGGGGGGFEATLDLPGNLPAGQYFLRAYVAGADGAALGAREVRIAPEEKK